MRFAGVVLPTLLLLPACGEAEIVSRARKNSEATTAGGAPSAGATPAGAAAPTSSPSGAGTPSAAGAPTASTAAGVPEQPKPGVPAEPTPAAPGSPQPGTPVQPGAVPGAEGQGAGKAGEPTPGVPEQPAPGIPSQPPPGQGGTMQQLDGPTATVKGTVIFPGYTAGSVRVDAFDGDHSRPGTHPRIVATTKIDRPGAFSLTVSQAVGKVFIEASIDEDGDGRPGPQDPQGVAERYPVTVSSDVSGIAVTLTKREPPPGGKNKDDF